jgi:4-amino-4-deoxy-L-arabinose transferase-like glycosyltransferase
MTGEDPAGQRRAVGRSAGPPLAAILVAYLALAVAYGAINPLFEAPDEHHHFFAAKAIVDTGRLPSTLATDPATLLARQEAAQPPLYYLISALIIRPIDLRGAEEALWSNPFVRLGDARSPDNRNAFIHPPAEGFPWRGHVLAAHLLRLLSAVFGLGTVLCVYASGRTVWPERAEPALLAALVAFLPQFLFLHGSISNDPAIIFLCALALLQLIRIWQTGISAGRALALGCTIGLAILSKGAGLLLLAYALGFLVLVAWRDRPGRALWSALGRVAALVLVPALAVGGWLLLRNLSLYGDATAAGEFIRFAGGDRGYTLGQVLAESGGLWRSLVGVFGWLTVAPPPWFYWLHGALVAAALAGALLALGRALTGPPAPAAPVTGREPAGGPRAILRRPWTLAALLALWLLLVYAGLVRFMLQTPAAQGRLLFPALVPLALGLAYGLTRYRRAWVSQLAALLALFGALYCLLFVIRPAYAPASILAEGAIPASATLIGRHLGPGLELVAAEMETDEAAPGDLVWLTLYWRAEAASAPAPVEVVEAFGRQRELVGKVEGYHGRGLYPAGLWPTGQVIAERLALRLADRLNRPARVVLVVRLGGEVESADVGSVKIAPPRGAAVPAQPLATLEGIELLEASLSAREASPGDRIEVRLLWRVGVAPGRDLTTFVHLGDPAQQPLAQGDSPPLAGDYPAHLWEAGEVIIDSYALTMPAGLPEGEYPVQIGLYDPASGARLPMVTAGGRRPQDAYPIGSLVVRR